VHSCPACGRACDCEEFEDGLDCAHDCDPEDLDDEDLDEDVDAEAWDE